MHFGIYSAVKAEKLPMEEYKLITGWINPVLL